MRLVFAGTPAVALPAFEAVLASRHEVLAVLTRPDAPTGRGRGLSPSPVAARARDAGLETLTPRSLRRDPEVLERLRVLAPDCAPVVAYGQLVPPEALAVPRHGWVNLHFSLLPAWRGAAPVQHALLAGDEVTGAATFQLEEGLDTGPVYGVVTEPVRPTDTSGDLLDRLSRSGAELLVATLHGIEAGTLRPEPQPAEGVSLAPKIDVDGARVDWNAPALRVDRLVRASTPAPGAWTTFRGRRVKLGPVRLTAEPPGGLPPGVLALRARTALVAGTGTAPVLLDRVRPEGRGEMPATDWARGLRLEPGEGLE